MYALIQLKKERFLPFTLATITSSLYRIRSHIVQHLSITCPVPPKCHNSHRCCRFWLGLAEAHTSSTSPHLQKCKIMNPLSTLSQTLTFNHTQNFTHRIYHSRWSWGHHMFLALFFLIHLQKKVEISLDFFQTTKTTSHIVQNSKLLTILPSDLINVKTKFDN